MSNVVYLDNYWNEADFDDQNIDPLQEIIEDLLADYATDILSLMQRVANGDPTAFDQGAVLIDVYTLRLQDIMEKHNG